MTKPVCVPCQRFFRPERNGQVVLEQMPVGGAGRVPPGTTRPDLWKPYKLWMADRWRCHGCGAEIVVGFASRPIAEQHDDKFSAMLEEERAKMITVNDC